jgi:hypothetical protein
MATPPPDRFVSLTIRNMTWPRVGQVRPTLCTEDGDPLAGQVDIQIDENRVTVTFILDGDKVRFA